MEPLHDIPNQWAWTVLEDIGDISSGGTPRTAEEDNFDGDIAWITPADLTGYKSQYIASGRRNISDKGLRTSSAKLVPKGTVLFSSRAPIGYVVIASNPLCTNQGFKNLTPAAQVSSEYIYYYLKGSKNLAESLASGTTFLELSASRFAKIPVPLAPFNEQRRIVSKIEELFSRLDEGEAALRRVHRLINSYRQAVLKAAVTGELIGVDGGKWRQCTIGDLLTDLRYGTAKKCSYDPSKTPVLRIPNVVTGKIDLSDLKHTDFTKSEIEKLGLRKDDILLVRSNGSVNLVARSAIVGDEAEGFIFAGYLIRLRLRQDKVLPSYLHLFLHSPHIRSHIERQARSTSGVHNINSDEIKSLVLKLPPLSNQVEIVDRIEDIFSRIDALEAWCNTELTRSATLRQSILKAAFSGKLVPQDPNDEPASALLQRIQATWQTPAAKPIARPLSKEQGKHAPKQPSLWEPT
jgi:type I restriction enzyme S subunit